MTGLCLRHKPVHSVLLNIIEWEDRKEERTCVWFDILSGQRSDNNPTINSVMCKPLDTHNSGGVRLNSLNVNQDVRLKRRRHHPALRSFSPMRQHLGSGKRSPSPPCVCCCRANPLLTSETECSETGDQHNANTYEGNNEPNRRAKQERSPLRGELQFSITSTSWSSSHFPPHYCSHLTTGETLEI